jgi:hypothetical protein
MRRSAAGVMVLVLLTGACMRDGEPEAASATASTDLHHIVFDTDLAFDDIMALLYLLQRDDVVLDAVTITGTGEAHCVPGVRNALGLLALGGERDTPVACGRETPLQGSNAFPTNGVLPSMTCRCWTCPPWMARPIRGVPRTC